MPPFGVSNSIDAIEIDLQEAFNLWEANSGLELTHSSKNVDIEISFQYRDHGDLFPFNGPGEVVAHAFFPLFGGDVHLDSEETWLTDAQTGPPLTSTQNPPL